ncbi:MAG: acyl-CoA dehydratase activase [Bacteroidetes bacterium]|nr:acyl-CoA dehydratase activase [Bacteroidota bacterium]
MSNYYLGIDAGSSFTKFVVIDESNIIVYQSLVKTLTRNKDEENAIIKTINDNYKIERTGATGYGRQYYKNVNVIKTELYCASTGLTELYPFEKNIIDIGGEDIKIIKSASNGKVIDFYMNTRCAAGTGAFITEVAEKAEIELSEMSSIAEKSNFSKELNSFCTVFAKTEVMQWIFDNVPAEDIAKGIYISVVNRIKKIPMDKTLPIILIGGVAKYHPYIKTIMEEYLMQKVTVPENPQYINAFGASLFAKNNK